MTFPASVANLTKAVNEITAETNVPKSILDAKVAQAEAQVPLAQTEQATAEGYRNTAATNATSAAASLATVKSTVVMNGIPAVSGSKTGTAVDTFIYDTSLDSDGGAWRKRCQHTSWFNEALNTATRGSRREFPAVALIVATSSAVTIYDGDTVGLPMWIVFTPSAAPAIPQIWRSGRFATSVTAQNGIVCLGVTTDGQGGLVLMDLGADKMSRYAADVHTGGISVAQRNEPLTTASLSTQRIVNVFVNDVAMTVLPNAPIDAATGLPVPTIAVATDGGVSVIKDDGTVGNLVNYVTAPARLAFADVGGVKKIFTTSRYANWVNMFDIPTGNVNTGNNWALFSVSGLSFGRVFEETETNLAVGASNALVLYQKDQVLTNLSGPSGGNVNRFVGNFVTSTYTTGWMLGNIKGAWLSNTSATNLVSVTPFSDDFSTYADDAALQSIWTRRSLTETGLTLVSGAMRVENLAAANEWVSRTFSTVIGATYHVRARRVSAGANLPRVLVGPGNLSGTLLTLQFAADGQLDGTFQATGTTTFLSVTTNSGSVGAFAVIDDIEVVLADADRTNNKGLIVNGTITRTAVATGAELVGYSGFSATNYLEQPYNSALDFGTGDFSIMGWVKGQQLYDTLFVRSDGVTTSSEISIQTGDTANNLRLFINGGFVHIIGILPSSGWFSLVVARESGAVKIYVNGALVHSFANTSNLTQSGAKLTFGNAYNTASPSGVDSFNGELALWRFSSTAPTANQIKKIYDDERRLFQPGAACTLFGTSDAVTALAHDPKTNLLHVGTSSGRSVFDGLVRVANTTTPVTTAISAVNGLIAEQ